MFNWEHAVRQHAMQVVRDSGQPLPHRHLLVPVRIVYGVGVENTSPPYYSPEVGEVAVGEGWLVDLFRRHLADQRRI